MVQRAMVDVCDVSMLQQQHATIMHLSTFGTSRSVAVPAERYLCSQLRRFSHNAMQH